MQLIALINVKNGSITIGRPYKSTKGQMCMASNISENCQTLQNKSLRNVRPCKSAN